MATLRDIRKQIGSVQSTQQITRAMKMVAAAKLRRAQEAIVAARPYSDAVSKLFRHLACHAGDSPHPLLQPRPTRRTLLFVITSDRGLCGGFNANLLRAVNQHLQASGGADGALSLALVGRKGIDHYRRRPAVSVWHTYPEMLAPFDYGKAAAAADDLTRLYLEGQVDRITLVYSRFVSPMQQQVTWQPLLPLGDVGEPVGIDYLYEPSREVVWEQAIPKYLHFEVFRCLLDSIAGEFGARMTAMESATQNAGEMIDRLTLQMNRARQSTITKELMEIISGKEAMS